MDLFDTHFHLPKEGPLDDYLDILNSEHRYRMLALGASVESSIRAFEFAQKSDNVWCACGVHPHDAENFSGDLAPFADMLADKKVRAVGEIGLDFFYDYSPRTDQIRCFEKFLALALEHNKPVSVHCRDQEERLDAYNETYAMLKDFACDAGPEKIILHCYAGNRDFLEKFLELGAFIGVTGMVTFPRSNNIRENLEHIPRERLLLETDSPYLAPVPFRGKTNHPAMVAVIARYVADFLKIPPEELSALTTGNALRVFELGEEDI